MRTARTPATSALSLATELGVTVQEVNNYLDDLAGRIGRWAVFTIDELVRPEVAARMRSGR